MHTHRTYIMVVHMIIFYAHTTARRSLSMLMIMNYEYEY